MIRPLRFVSAIHIPPFAPSILLSGGGDQAINCWDWLAGQRTGELPVLDTVKPFIKVLSKKRKRGENEEDGDDGAEGSSKPIKPHGKKGRGKNKKKVGEQQTPEAAEDGNHNDDGDTKNTEMVEDDSAERTEKSTVPGSASPAPAGEGVSEPSEPTLVLKTILTLEADGKQIIMFQSVGYVTAFLICILLMRSRASAIFWCPFDSLGSHAVKAYDFGVPVLGVIPALQLGQVWVLLDAHWTNPTGPSQTAPPSAVKLVQLTPEAVRTFYPAPNLRSTFTR
jgi:tRNA (guanine-N(7)-)-methyltransferase subunit TRM82